MVGRQLSYDAGAQLKTRIKNAIPIVLKLLFAVGLIFWLFSKGVLNWQDLGALLSTSSVTIGLLLLGLNLAAATYRWDLLLRACGIEVQRSRLYKLELIGVFFNYAIPGGVGGDLVKGYYTVQEHPERRLNAGLSVLLDRILGVYTMLIVSILSMAVNWGIVLESGILKSLAVFTFLVFIAINFLLALGFSDRIRESRPVVNFLEKVPGGSSVSKVYDGLKLYRNQVSTLIKALFMSLVAQILTISFFVFVGQTLNLDYSLWLYFFAVPLGLIASSIPLSPAGIGVGQVAMLTLFNLYLPGSGKLGALSMTAFHIGFFVWGLLGAIFYLQRSKMEPAKLS